MERFLWILVVILIIIILLFVFVWCPGDGNGKPVGPGPDPVPDAKGPFPDPGTIIVIDPDPDVSMGNLALNTSTDMTIEGASPNSVGPTSGELNKNFIGNLAGGSKFIARVTGELDSTPGSDTDDADVLRIRFKFSNGSLFEARRDTDTSGNQTLNWYLWEGASGWAKLTPREPTNIEDVRSDMLGDATVKALEIANPFGGALMELSDLESMDKITIEWP